jgi:hypothetical protein
MARIEREKVVGVIDGNGNDICIKCLEERGGNISDYPPVRLIVENDEEEDELIYCDNCGKAI